MHTKNSVDIRGDIGRVWELAAAVERWPEILPHYRYVTTVQQSGPRRIVEMAAWRGRLPIRWLAVFEPLPAEHRLLFDHIGGGARGMQVEWTIVQHDDVVRATIEHDLASPYRIIRNPLGEYILGTQFVGYVAGCTLARIKELVEAEVGANATSLASGA